MTTDRDWRIQSWSPRTERSFGWTEPRVLGRFFADAVIPDISPAFGGGSDVTFVAVARDISERIAADEALARSRMEHADIQKSWYRRPAPLCFGC